MSRPKKQFELFAINDKNEICRVIATKHGRTYMDVIFDGQKNPVTVKTFELYSTIPDARNAAIQTIRMRKMALKTIHQQSIDDQKTVHKKAIKIFDEQIKLIRVQAEELRKNIPVGA